LVNDNKLISLLTTNCSLRIFSLGIFVPSKNRSSRLFLFLYMITTVSLLTVPCFAKIDPPNYEFTLAKFDDFLPGTDISKVKKKLGPGTIVEKKGNLTTLRFYINHVRYKFPILNMENKIIIFLMLVREFTYGIKKRRTLLFMKVVVALPAIQSLLI